MPRQVNTLMGASIYVAQYPVMEVSSYLVYSTHVWGCLYASPNKYTYGASV
jgi:hypothetical protein